MRALAMLLQGQDAQNEGNLPAAAEAYRRAIDIAERDTKSDVALVWAIRQKVMRKRK